MQIMMNIYHIMEIRYASMRHQYKPKPKHIKRYISIAVLLL